MPLFSNPNNIFQQEDFFKGMTYAGFSSDVFASMESDISIDRLATTHTRSVAIVLNWYQDTGDSTEIKRDPHKTVTDESLVHLIKHLRSHGFSILLKPAVDASDHTWRGKFKPKDPNAWFDSYFQFILHYAKMAEEHGIELFSVGVEYPMDLSVDQTYWKNIILGVREIYSGKLTYSANFAKPGSYKQVAFWDLLDFIGIDAYFAVSKRENPSSRHIAKCWKKHIKKISKWLKHTYPNKPVLFTEIGLRSNQAAAKKPWKYDDAPLPDAKEQARYYKAFFKAFREIEWLKGVYWWWWDNPSTSDYIHHQGDYAHFYTPKGKPSEDILRKYYG